MNVVSILLCVALAAPVDAQPSAVDDAIAQAQAYAATGDFQRALATVREARRESKDAALIFVEAQLLRLSGDCSAALGHYQAFLATDPPAEDRAVARANLQACEAALPTSPVVTATELPTEPRADAPSATREPTVVAEQPAAPAKVTLDRPVSRKRDVLGIALWTTGGVTLAAGIGVYGAAWIQRGNADRGSPNLDAYLDKERQARTLSGVGIATMAIGTGIVIAAAVRHIIVVHQRRSARR